MTDYHIPDMTDYCIPEGRMDAIVYYRKDPSWLAMSPLAPPDIESPDALVEVHREQVAIHWNRGRMHLPSDSYILEDIWKKMQNIDSGDLPARLGVRSMMVGDVIVVDKRGWMVQATGWSEIPIDKELWGCAPSP
jgi:hypothetical protein